MANWFDKFGNSIISGGSSLISGIFGTLAQNRNVSKQIKAQQAENERARAYNLELAKLQNNWNIAQWNRENAYNDPSAYMARLKSAKLNPDLVYGGAQNLGSASSPSMTSGAPAVPTDMSAIGQKRTIGDAVQQGLRDSLVGAQIDVMKSQARKNNAEAGGQEITNETLGQINQATFNKLVADAGLSREQTRVAEKTGDMLISQKKNFDAMSDKARSDIKANEAHINDLTNQQLYRRVDRLLSVGSLAMEWEKFMLDLGVRRDELSAKKQLWIVQAKKYIADIQNESADNFLSFLSFLKDAGLPKTMKVNLEKMTKFYENLDFSELDSDFERTFVEDKLDKYIGTASHILSTIAIGLGIGFGVGKFSPKVIKGFAP